MTERAEDRLENGETAFVDLKRRVIHAEDRLSEIKSELRELNASVRELNTTIANMGKPHYQTWTAFAGLFCTVSAAVWWLAVTPLNDRLKTLENVAATAVSRDVLVEKWAQTDKEFQRIENEIAARATKDDLNRLIIETDRRLPRAKEK
jgi:chromosome segregation ATPase